MSAKSVTPGAADAGLQAPPAAPIAKPAKASGTVPKAADRIRAIAQELFYREGIRAVGVDEIVTRAGVTKPSLYRSFGSKDELAAAYMRDYDADYWRRFDATIAEHPDDPRAQLLAVMARIGQRTQTPNYRGCGMTNAAVEYPARDNPARRVAEANKTELRRRLTKMADALGAEDAVTLGDGLLLLMEGSYASAQVFGPGGPGRSIAAVAALLIDSCPKRPSGNA